MNAKEKLIKAGMPERTVDIYCYYYEGLTQAQVAELLGISRRTVIRHLAKLRQQFPKIVPTYNQPKTIAFQPGMHDSEAVTR